jgi:hypothetical protein
MATGLIYESPYWIGWLSGSWGLSWGYSADGSPIEVDDPVYYGGGKAYVESDAERTRLFREHHDYLDSIRVQVAERDGATINVDLPLDMPLPKRVMARAMRGNVLPNAPTVADIIDDPDALCFMALLIVAAFDE